MRNGMLRGCLLIIVVLVQLIRTIPNENQKIHNYLYERSYFLLHQPSSAYDDPKNILLTYHFERFDLGDPSKMLEKAIAVCNKDPEFLRQWNKNILCEYDVALNMLKSAMNDDPNLTESEIEQIMESIFWLNNQQQQTSQSAIKSVSNERTRSEIESNIPTTQNSKKIFAYYPPKYDNLDNQTGDDKQKQTDTQIQSLNTFKNVALIVPVTSKGIVLSNSHAISELPLFTYLIQSLVELQKLESSAINCKDKLYTGSGSCDNHINIMYSLYIGYDAGDIIYDNTENLQNILDSLSFFLPHYTIKLIKVNAILSNKVVHIWNYLVSHAFYDQTDYYMMLNDDVIIETPFWAEKLIQKLQNNHLLSNFGTVAFYDKQQPYFPTFPCFSHVHLEIFGELSAFDTFFVNSFADPWLSDIYAIFDSAYLAEDVILNNIIGGVVDDSVPTATTVTANSIGGNGISVDSSNNNKIGTRYVPKHPNMENYIDLVQRARRTIIVWLCANKKVNFVWNPTSLAYGEEGIFYDLYCKNTPGCQVKLTNQHENMHKRRLPYS